MCSKFLESLYVMNLVKQTWMYIAIPVVLYAGERVFRAIRSGFYEVKILKVSQGSTYKFIRSQSSKFTSF